PCVKKVKVLGPALRAPHRLSYEPAHPQLPGRRFHLEKTRKQLAPHQIANPVAQRFCHGKLKDNPLISDERKGDTGMSDRLEIELVLNVPRFSILRAEKLPARRQIIEERAHLDLRPRRFSTIAHRLDSPARDDHLRPRDGLLFPG